MYVSLLCLYVPGFQRQVFKYVPKLSDFDKQNFSGFRIHIPIKVNFVGTFILLRIPQEAIIASCSGFRNCKWMPQNVSEIRKCKWNPHFCLLLNLHMNH